MFIRCASIFQRGRPSQQNPATRYPAGHQGQTLHQHHLTFAPSPLDAAIQTANRCKMACTGLCSPARRHDHIQRRINQGDALDALNYKPGSLSDIDNLAFSNGCAVVTRHQKATVRKRDLCRMVS